MPRVIALLLLALVAIAVPAQAQPVQEAVVSWDVEFFAAGVNTTTGSPLMAAANITVASSTCNVTKVPAPTTTQVNPTKIRVDDPFNANRDCVLGTVTSAGLLMSVPLGVGIQTTARARGATTVSARSAAGNPFNRAVIPVAPDVPTGVRVIE